MSRIFRIILLICVVIYSMGCGTIRMRYDSDLQTPEGKTAHYVYEKSYEIPLYPTLCGLSAIFFGGACWFYLVMPTVHQDDFVTKDALSSLDQRLKTDKYKITRQRLSRVNWEDQPELTEFKTLEDQK